MIVFLLLGLASLAHPQLLPSCDSPVYCYGALLDTIQMAQIYSDSKTFVDMRQLNPVQTTLDNFQTFQKSTPNPSKAQILQFVSENFATGDEFEDWTPTDYSPTPKLLNKISDKDVRKFAENLVKIWPNLSKKVKPEVWTAPERYSLIPVKEGFVIPGGRFREFYYWDSYWIIKGLLLSDMPQTVRGMLDNFISLVNRYGFIPNGARVYYLNRSQPPLLTLMAFTYVEDTEDVEWLKNNIEFLDHELKFWLNNRTVKVTKNKNTYELCRYDASSGTPRPESYLEDVRTALTFSSEVDKELLYINLKSGAESGHDFSSRWIIDSQGGNDANLTYINTTNIIPVDLNAILCQAFKKLSNLYLKLDDSFSDRAIFWHEKYTTWEKSIQAVHYHKKDGIWYDWDLKLAQPRRYFYASNFAPLWAEAYDPLQAEMLGHRAVKYLEGEGILEFQGGIPTSLLQSGEQWDYPNAWPPLQAFVVMGLQRSGNCDAKRVAKELAERWVQANVIGYNEAAEMFEKYDANEPGKYGGGGEYQVQSGFGWTNGVVLELIEHYYTNGTK